MTEHMIRKTYEAMDKILEQPHPERNEKPLVMIFGGEPLLPPAKDRVKLILEETFERSFDVIIIVTNGTHLRHFIDLLGRYTPREIHVTLDGPKHIHDRRRPFKFSHGSFNNIVERIGKLLREIPDIRVSIRVNVDRDNIESLSELAKFILERSWPATGRVFVYIAPVEAVSCPHYSKQCYDRCRAS